MRFQTIQNPMPWKQHGIVSDATFVQRWIKQMENETDRLRKSTRLRANISYQKKVTMIYLT